MSLITITSGIGSGGMTIARLVANGLKLDLYDDQRLQQEAINIGISSEEVKDFDQKAPGLFNRILSHKPQAYLGLMEALVYEVARRGHGIILGHGAQFLLRDFGCALHVHIYSPESPRIQSLMDQQGISRDTAEKIIHKSDSERRGFLQFAFQIDWDDPSMYDLIINQSKLGADSAAKLIIDVAQSQQIKACSITAMYTMERLSLLKKVEAAVLKNKISSQDFHIEVPERGVVQIIGSLNPLESESGLLEVVKGVQGVLEVRSEIVVPELHDIG
ncbi:MAG: cytidylate kinase-like family protein [Deltaproteobacteria bacterium]|nr:cytidylate kinase-like family protein [Deltaproteobacteria bacterium]